MVVNSNANTISINGFDMYYEIHGQGQPLLCLHGFTGSGKALVAAFKNLSSTNKLIIPDLRGHGRSTNPSKEFTFKQAASDVFALLNYLDIRECFAIGFSGGGCILLQMACQEPERIKSMAIVSAAPYFPKQTREIMRQFTIESKTKEEWEAMRSIHMHGDEQIKMLWGQASQLAENEKNMHMTSEMLAKITAKTLIVQGDRDPLYPIELTIEMYKSLPNVYLWIIPNGGHVPISRDSTQEFISYLEKFIL